MKNVQLLQAIYNDKEMLKKIHKSLDEYITNMRSMEQLRRDSKDIENHIKERYKITPTLFKKLAKAMTTQNDTTDEVIDELQLIRDIAQKAK